MWEGVGDRIELQHIDPHSYGHNCVSFPFSWAAQPGPGGPASLEHVPQSSIFSPTCLIPNCSIEGLRAPSAGCWLSLTHLVFNWSGLQNWLNFLCTVLYNSSTPTFFLWASFNPSTVKVILCYSSTGSTCYLHRCISYFDSPARWEVNIQHRITKKHCKSVF